MGVTGGNTTTPLLVVSAGCGRYLAQLMSFVATAEVFSSLHAQLASRGVDIDTKPFFIDGTNSREPPSSAYPKKQAAQAPVLDNSTCSAVQCRALQGLERVAVASCTFVGYFLANIADVALHVVVGSKWRGH